MLSDQGPCVVFLAAVLFIGCGKSCSPFATTRLVAKGIAWSDLTSQQMIFFGSGDPGSTPIQQEQRWVHSSLSEQIEFALGTRALSEACDKLNCVDSLNAVNADLGTQWNHLSSLTSISIGSQTLRI